MLGDVNGRSAERSEASDCTEAAVIGLRAELAALDGGRGERIEARERAAGAFTGEAVVEGAVFARSCDCALGER